MKNIIINYMKTPKKRTSLVWRYMREEGDKVKCTITGCNKSFNNTTSTHNLKAHLIDEHKIMFPDKDPLKQQTLDMDICSKSPFPERKAKEINKLLVYTIACANLPISFVESVPFTRFCKALCPQYTLPIFYV
eukprot:TRINITY_DN9550_c0_g1_i5.p4 TRINITY_DN9550_c0_g1~~TRINITY_DN9550_c0_g1_i5.p4  ORF type:complete len:133 (-),score=11.69 TRINITY_DN9550_c0_g1_i5:96-494(-)